MHMQLALSHHNFVCFGLFIKHKTSKMFWFNSKAEGIPSTEEEIQPTIGEHIAFAIGQLADLICKHSYILSNITMMVIFELSINIPHSKNVHIYLVFFRVYSQVWSIVYHSWLTFLFLLIANLLWIIPNQRVNMHRLSPFVVIYAIFLLVSQYLYCMNLTEEELPAVSNNRTPSLIRSKSNYSISFLCFSSHRNIFAKSVSCDTKFIHVSRYC